MNRPSTPTTACNRNHPARRWRVRGHSAIAALVFAAPLALGTPPAEAASHRLSQGLPFGDAGFLGIPTKLSSDGQFAVYVHDATVDEAGELWSVRVAGGAPVRLSGSLPASVTVQAFAISADSQHVVYMVAQETAGLRELYSIPIAGPEGAWIKLNGALPDGGGVYTFEISPDSTRVVYVAEQYADEVFDVWTVPIDGGTSTRLRPPVTLLGSGVGDDLEISPDGERVTFSANFADLGKSELWSARVDGTGAVIRLNGTLTTGGNVTSGRFSPDSSRVVYRADQQSDGVLEIYSVPSAGGSAVKLNGVLTSGGTVATYEISPDSTRVIYLADQQVDGRVELFSVPLAGGGATKLNGALPAGGSVTQSLISPDSSRVVYRADEDSDNVYELFSVQLAGGGAVKLNPALIAGGDVIDQEISPDSARVVYRADQNVDEVRELFSVPLAGGASVQVSDDLAVGGDVLQFEIAPTSDFAFYIADLVTDGTYELFRGRLVDIAGADIRVSGPMVAGGGSAVDDLAVLPDGRQAIYNADQEVDGQTEVYIGDICLLCDGFEAGDLGRWD